MTRSFTGPFFVLTLIVTLVAGPRAAAQTDYTVTLAQKSTSHPYHGQGEPEAFVIDGVEANHLTLMRGQTYRFNLVDISVMHPFYISSSGTGGGGAVWNEGVQGNFSTGNATVTFTVPENAPNTLWYQCGAHFYMGGQLTIVGGTDTGHSPTAEVPFAVSVPAPNPAAGFTMLRLDLPVHADVSVALYDLLGRQVLSRDVGVLPAGSDHEIRLVTDGLGAGVYVYRLYARASREMLTAGGSIVLAP